MRGSGPGGHGAAAAVSEVGHRMCGVFGHVTDRDEALGPILIEAAQRLTHRGYCGPAHATETAKIYLLAGHQDGQLPFSAMVRRSGLDDRAIAESVSWVEANYATPNPVAAMTERSGLTSWTFARRFLAATGRRPIDYVQALRIEAARERLEADATPVDEIGFAVGCEDPTFFRRLFKRVTGMTPAAYRRKYAPIATIR